MFGGSIETTYDKIVKALGEPDEVWDHGEKTDFAWNFRLDGINFDIRVYNFKWGSYCRRDPKYCPSWHWSFSSNDRTEELVNKIESELNKLFNGEQSN